MTLVKLIIWFQVQFGINSHEWVFQKTEIAWAAKSSKNMLRKSILIGILYSRTIEQYKNQKKENLQGG